MKLRYAPTGDATTDFINNVYAGAQNIGTLVNPAIEIAADPALPQIAMYVQQLHDLEQVPGEPPIAGVGLNRLVTPLSMYVEYRKNPLLIGALAVGLVIGLPFLLGYYVGKK